jgi:hypothetical protein
VATQSAAPCILEGEVAVAQVALGLMALVLHGGNGGAGTSNDISGSSLFYAGGGGGGII